MLITLLWIVAPKYAARSTGSANGPRPRFKDADEASRKHQAASIAAADQYDLAFGASGVPAKTKLWALQLLSDYLDLYGILESHPELNPELIAARRIELEEAG